MWVLVVRSFPTGHAARYAAHASLLFTLTESAIGAGLVLFKLVAQDMSVYRAVAISAHLVNTFLLVACLALTVMWTDGRPPIRISGQGAVAWLVGAALVGVILVGVTGAVTALGDTLFKGKSLQEIQSSTSGSIPFFVSLRVYHPMAAVGVGIFSAFSAWLVASLRPGSRTHAAAYWVTLLVVVQICAGFANYLMRVPLVMQLIHLLLADALWIALVAMAAAALADGAPRAIGLSQKSMSPESTR
jgi:heme A synthase